MGAIITYILIAWLLETCCSTKNILRALLQVPRFVGLPGPSSSKMQFGAHINNDKTPNFAQGPQRRTTRKPFRLARKNIIVKDLSLTPNESWHTRMDKPRRLTTCKMATCCMDQPPKFDEEFFLRLETGGSTR